MLPEFALHHLLLYVTLACSGGAFAAWTWARIVVQRQSRDDRLDTIATRALNAVPTPEAIPRASGDEVQDGTHTSGRIHSGRIRRR